MPLIAQPQDSYSRVGTRPDGRVPAGDGLPARAAPPFMARRRHEVLSQTIKQEIVPRLLLVRGTIAAAVPNRTLPLDGDVEALVDILLRQELAQAVNFVGDVSARGVVVETIYLDLLAPTARRLGIMWDEDLCDFSRVTIGLMRLQQVLGGLAAPFQADANRPATKTRVLLVPAPGDSHSFGLSMVASFFQRAGWSGWSGVPESPADLVRMVRDDEFAVIGFSVGCQTRLDGLSAAIRSVRRASMNRDIRVMVGGPLFVEHPELVGMVGADATAADGRQAVLQARNLLALIPSRT